MIKRTVSLLILTMVSVSILMAQHQPEFSTAGFHQIDNSGREVYSMNPAWRLHKGEVTNGELKSFDDSKWELTSLPDGIELQPVEASGCSNYQGVAWYRKHFTPNESLKGDKLFLHFEGIMGKSRIYINGKLLKEHFGGFLPAIVDITKGIEWGTDNVIAVWTDNSDDPNYPPGKFQDVLDFTYSGGIYRDCWLIAHNDVYITDPNYEDIEAGGGLFVSYNNISKKSADVVLDLHLRNESAKSFSGKVEYELKTLDGKSVKKLSRNVKVSSSKTTSTKDKIKLNNPQLWSPESPTLYNLIVRVKDNSGKVVDGYRQRIGIRSIEFKGEDGFWLNGEPYPHPLIGGNRHQDYAVVGNAVANSAHWRDAKKLRDAGMKMIRNAHYPQDPAFMDACDELGLFVIENTPGWQYWNEKPIFEQRVYNDIRNMVRRDRNRASVWMWEPILNETGYPAHFAKTAKEIVDKEFPYPYSYSASDLNARGSEHFPIQFGHPHNGLAGWEIKDFDSTKTYFTREWGDNVDDWSAQNSTSRIARNWGEEAMIVQAKHYADPEYTATSYDRLYQTTRQHVGGSLWHSFDHQRGYHPTPFYGGIMDIYRQPKYSYYMFMAQRDPKEVHSLADSGPMVYIANEMTPFSGKDVVVYSNCDEVKLSFNENGKSYTHKKDKKREGMPSPIITFKDVYDFMEYKFHRYHKDGGEVYLLAEGFIDGELVASHKVVPAGRPSKIKIWLDNEDVNLSADGSDFVTVVAAIVDPNGYIRRLNNDFIKFEIEGEGRLLTSNETMTNPVQTRWGTAPVLVQSTHNAGKIKIKASVLFEGSRMPVLGEIELESHKPSIPLIYSKSEASKITKTKSSFTRNNMDNSKKEESDARLKEVEQQQKDFGEI